jgi:hypothetical protein
LRPFSSQATRANVKPLALRSCCYSTLGRRRCGLIILLACNVSIFARDTHHRSCRLQKLAPFASTPCHTRSGHRPCVQSRRAPSSSLLNSSPIKAATCHFHSSVFITRPRHPLFPITVVLQSLSRHSPPVARLVYALLPQPLHYVVLCLLAARRCLCPSL